jgi:hypothetical protein
VADRRLPFVADIPELLVQWHTTRNAGLDPKTLSIGSGRVAWWRCEHGHELESRICVRAKARCGACAGRRAAPGSNVADCHPDLAAEWDPGNELEPDDVPPGSNKVVRWRCSKCSWRWDAPVSRRTGSSTRRPSGCPGCTGQVATPTNCLATNHPDLAAQWHPVRNGELTAADVTPGSRQVAWWAATCGHEWDAPVVCRAVQGHGCPFCAGARLDPRHSLSVLRPLVAAEWHPTRNGSLRPEQVADGSGRQVWWSCSKCSWEWRTTVSTRRGCPGCAGRSATPHNNLTVCRPELAAEWHPTANDPLSPADVTAGGSQKVWWKCPACGHSWEARVGSRGAGAGCPACAGHVVTKDSCLSAADPELARWWDPLRNDRGPHEVTAHSSYRAWWLCPAGHSFDVVVADRAARRGGTACRVCEGTIAAPGTSLADLDQALAREWHPTRNGPVTADQVVPGSAFRAWWRCEKCQHEWDTQVLVRSRGAGCPACGEWGTSSTERALASLLAEHIPVQDNHPPVVADGKAWRCDIVVPGWDLIIEYDGSYWHSRPGSQERDQRKVEALSSAGWRTVRIRQEPLDALSADDLVVPARAKIAAVTSSVLDHLHRLGYAVEHPATGDRAVR